MLRDLCSDFWERGITTNKTLSDNLLPTAVTVLVPTNWTTLKQADALKQSSTCLLSSMMYVIKRTKQSEEELHFTQCTHGTEYDM